MAHSDWGEDQTHWCSNYSRLGKKGKKIKGIATNVS